MLRECARDHDPHHRRQVPYPAPSLDMVGALSYHLEGGSTYDWTRLRLEDMPPVRTRRFRLGNAQR